MLQAKEVGGHHGYSRFECVARLGLGGGRRGRIGLRAIAPGIVGNGVECSVGGGSAWCRAFASVIEFGSIGVLGLGFECVARLDLRGGRRGCIGFSAITPVIGGYRGWSVEQDR